MIQCGSNSLTLAKSRYAMIELELLSIVFTLVKLSFYLRGIDLVTVRTDHHPLLDLYKKPLTEISNNRLLRLMERTLWGQYKGGKLGLFKKKKMS